jgi:hypothetical protein
MAARSCGFTMITSAENRRWAGDFEIKDLDAAGADDFLPLRLNEQLSVVA